MSDANLHSGHRQRLINRFLKSGLDGFEPHNILELLLFGALPRCDTNEIAHKLIDKFGFCGVFEASAEELQSVDKVGPAAAAQIKLVLEAARKYQQYKNENVTKIQSLDEVADYISAHYYAKDIEILYMMSLDGLGNIIKCEVIAEGDACSVNFNVRKIVERAISNKASAVVLAHNHPISTALPSHDDVSATKELASILANIGVSLLDHLIFAPDGQYISTFQSRLL